MFMRKQNDGSLYFYDDSEVLQPVISWLEIFSQRLSVSRLSVGWRFSANGYQSAGYQLVGDFQPAVISQPVISQ
jgi:hypothetical protein